MNDQQGMSDDTIRDLAEKMMAMKTIRDMQTGAPGKADPFEAAVAKLPGKGEWVKAAPGVAMVCGTLLMLTFVIVFAVLSVTGTPTDPFFRLVNLFLNALGAITTLCILAVAMLQGRRSLTNRAVAAKAASEAHDAAENSEATRSEVNGKLVSRLVQALRPVIRQAVDDAVNRAVSERCPDSDDGAR